jgi:hypothetical protein
MVRFQTLQLQAWPFHEYTHFRITSSTKNRRQRNLWSNMKDKTRSSQICHKWYSGFLMLWECNTSMTTNFRFSSHTKIWLIWVSTDLLLVEKSELERQISHQNWISSLFSWITRGDAWILGAHCPSPSLMKMPPQSEPYQSHNMIWIRRETPDNY